MAESGPIPVQGRIVHIAGIVVNYGSRRRQRCAWCGAMLEDVDLATVAVQLPHNGSDPAPLPTWEVGGLVLFWGPVRQLVEPHLEMLEDGTPAVRLPDDCCAKLPAEMTT